VTGRAQPTCGVLQLDLPLDDLHRQEVVPLVQAPVVEQQAIGLHRAEPAEREEAGGQGVRKEDVEIPIAHGTAPASWHRDRETPGPGPGASPAGRGWESDPADALGASLGRAPW